MDYTMNIIINRNNFNQIYAVLRDARSRLHKMPECVLSSYKPYITMENEFSCLQTIRKKAEVLDDDSMIVQVKTSSDYTQNGRFTHSPLNGDPLTLSRGVRDFLLSNTGLYCVDLSGCEARIAGELSGDANLIDLGRGFDYLFELGIALEIVNIEAKGRVEFGLGFDSIHHCPCFYYCWKKMMI